MRAAAKHHLVAAGYFGAVGLGLAAVQTVTGWGIGCPLRRITGILCPFCGSTHVGSSLLRGDLAGAWAANSFVCCGLVVLGLFVLVWTVTLAGGPALRLPGRLGESRTWRWGIIGSAVVFTVARNALGHLA